MISKKTGRGVSRTLKNIYCGFFLRKQFWLTGINYCHIKALPKMFDGILNTSLHLINYPMKFTSHLLNEVKAKKNIKLIYLTYRLTAFVFTFTKKYLQNFSSK